MKTCASCGASFAPTGPNHRFCSRDCRPCLRPKFPFGRRTCAACGTAFTRTSLAQHSCSRPCRPSEQPSYPQRKYIERVGRPLKTQGAKPDVAKRARVTALSEAGRTRKEIAAEVGVTPSSVGSMLRKIEQEKGVTPAP